MHVFDSDALTKYIIKLLTSGAAGAVQGPEGRKGTVDLNIKYLLNIFFFITQHASHCCIKLNLDRL